MSSTFWLIAATSVHAAFVAAAAVAVFRVTSYTNSQRAWQILVAVVLPILGAIVILAMAKAAVADPPAPSDSRFDPQSYNGE
jgi:hypothetical protein